MRYGRSASQGRFMTMIDQLTAQHFAPFIGKMVRPVGSEIELTLVAVNQHAWSGWEKMARKPFSLILRGPRQPILPEGPYEFVMEGESTPALYIIPVFTTAPRHQDYQIIFN